MLKLCSLYLAVEDLDSCQHQCMTLLKGDKENDAATVVSLFLVSQLCISLINSVM